MAPAPSKGSMWRKDFKISGQIDVDGVAEGAVDEGGATRVFFTIHQTQNNCIFEAPEGNKTLALDSVAFQTGQYRLVGRMIAICLVQGKVCPRFFSEHLYREIADATNVEGAREAVEEAREALSLMGSFSFVRSLPHRDELLGAALQFYTECRTLTALNQFKEGLETFGLVDLLRIHHEALEWVFRDTFEPLLASQLEATFKPSNLSEPGSNRRRGRGKGACGDKLVVLQYGIQRKKEFEQKATATPTKREPVASRLRNQGMAFSPTLKHGDVMDGQFPMIEVLNPQDGSPAYVFRAWRPSDIKDIAEWLPDPSAVGGAAFATALQELVQQHKASISEVRQLCTYSQSDMPGRDEAKKLQLAQLEALENPKPTRRNRDQRGDRPKEKRKENAGRWNCHYCGAKDHWIKDSRPVAQYSANTPRHNSSTSDFMKLQTMGGPPEELRNGLLDDTRRQSSRTNSTRVVASMVPV
ncbi:unnamed protein product [Gadus morhua 'NCC']